MTNQPRVYIRDGVRCWSAIPPWRRCAWASAKGSRWRWNAWIKGHQLPHTMACPSLATVICFMLS